MRRQSTTDPIPADFVELTDSLHLWMDRKLGYSGDARFVMFHIESDGAAIQWRDGLSSGPGSGHWLIFTDELEPSMRPHDGSRCAPDIKARRALVVDRQTHRAYFADYDTAEGFVAHQCRLDGGSLKQD